MAKADLTAQRLREILDYAPETGVFTWRQQLSYRGRMGAQAGSINAMGYRLIGIDGTKYYCHRLVWLYMFGQWPTLHIDHKDGDSLNNAINNLRDVSPKTNMQNLRKANRLSISGLIGASYDPEKRKWAACIKHAGKTLHIGRFPTAEEAHAAYLEAKRRLHAGCTI